MKFIGPEYKKADDQKRLKNQHNAIKELMLDGVWRTLLEISRATGHREASVSAQLRHLRKPRFGGYLVDRRHVESGLYQYRVSRPEPIRDQVEMPFMSSGVSCGI